MSATSPTAALREPAHRVDRRAPQMWAVAAACEALALAAAVVVVAALVDAVPLAWWWLAPLAVLLAAYVVVMPAWRWTVHRWEVTETAVHTQTGWWVMERRIAPMSRIQTVDFTQGPLARVFGLADVTVTTASAAGAIQIEGLGRDRARRLVDELTLAADAVAGDAT